MSVFLPLIFEVEAEVTESASVTIADLELNLPIKSGDPPFMVLGLDVEAEASVVEQVCVPILLQLDVAADRYPYTEDIVIALSLAIGEYQDSTGQGEVIADACVGTKEFYPFITGDILDTGRGSTASLSLLVTPTATVIDKDVVAVAENLVLTCYGTSYTNPQGPVSETLTLTVTSTGVIV